MVQCGDTREVERESDFLELRALEHKLYVGVRGQGDSVDVQIEPVDMREV